MDPRDVELWATLEHDNPVRLRELLASGAAPRFHFASGRSPLHDAIDCEADFSHQAGTPRDLRLIQPLLDAGADVNAVMTLPDGRTQTPLDVAVDYHYEEAVEVLLRAGARRGGP